MTFEDCIQRIEGLARVYSEFVVGRTYSPLKVHEQLYKKRDQEWALIPICKSKNAALIKLWEGELAKYFMNHPREEIRRRYGRDIDKGPWYETDEKVTVQIYIAVKNAVPEKPRQPDDLAVAG